MLTSNRTRELAEALRRRCVYHWIGYPDAEREAAIIMLRAGDVARGHRACGGGAVQTIRARPLAKPPGIAEAVEWANAATILEKGGSPWPEAFRRAIGVLIKDEEDLSYIAPELRPHRRGGAGVTARAVCPCRRAAATICSASRRLLRRFGFAVAPEQAIGFMRGGDAARASLDGRHPRGSARHSGATARPPRTNSRRMFRAYFYGDTAAVVEGESDEETRIKDDGGGKPGRNGR